MSLKKGSRRELISHKKSREGGCKKCKWVNDPGFLEIIASLAS
jgi:hypothetical protein